MSIEKLEKLEYQRVKIESKIQSLNSELLLKEYELKKVCKEISRIKTINSEVLK